jgi:hypothetical protein
MKDTPEFPEIRVLSMSKKQIGFMMLMGDRSGFRIRQSFPPETTR